MWIWSTRNIFLGGLKVSEIFISEGDWLEQLKPQKNQNTL